MATIPDNFLGGREREGEEKKEKTSETNLAIKASAENGGFKP